MTRHSLPVTRNYSKSFIHARGGNPLKDAFTKGFLAGAIANIPSVIVDLALVKGIGFGQTTYADFAAVLVYGHRPEGLFSFIFAQLVQWFFSALMGAVFAYWIESTHKAYLNFKGIVFGLTLWFLAYVLAIAYRLPTLSKVTLDSSIEHYIAAFIYGISLAVVYQRLDQGTEHV